MKRNKDRLSQRLCENIKTSRAGVNAEMINEFFRNLEEEIKDIPPCNIWNYDETGFVDDPGKKKILTKRGCKYPERIMNSTKTNISVMFCCNGNGGIAPPYVNYKSEKLWDLWTNGGPAKTRYNRSRSGWFDTYIFQDWFEMTMLPILKRQTGYKILIGDNLSSHINLRVIELCEQNEIKFIALPPNSTHLTQPLDVAYFRPLKGMWRTVLEKWRKTPNGKRCTTLPKESFPTLLKETLLNLTNSEETIKSGFRKTGIVPFNKETVLKRLPSNTNSTDTTQSETGSEVGESFLKRLESYRNADTSMTRQRKKKLAVPPGRSISLEDVELSKLPLPGEQVTSNSTNKKIQKKQEASTSSSISDSDEIVSLASSFEAESLENISGSEDNSTSGTIQEIPSTFEKQTVPKKGDHVIVKYEQNYYPGVVTELTEEGAVVSAMQKSNQTWKWPEKKDEIQYKQEEIVEIIKNPVMKSSRGFFDVPEIKKYE